MDEDALKRYTDCVYFLASPLTCKKGSECEFRHSEIARINPRDCRYWLSTGCLNRECPFRHPPLDGSTVTESNPLTSKVQVPCYYYYQGYCAKGDFCSFLHAAPSAPSLTISASAKHLKVTDPKPDAKPETTNASTEIVTKAVLKSREAVVSETISSRVVNPQQVNRTVHELLQLPSSSQSDSGGVGRALDGAVSPAPANGKWCVQPAQASEERLQSGEEAEENWKESSPGFDVLVDDGPEQLMYYSDGQFLSEQALALDSVQKLCLPLGARGQHSLEDFNHFDYLGGYIQPYTSANHFDHGGYDMYDEQFDYQHYDPYDEMLNPHAIYAEQLPDDYIHSHVEYLEGEHLEAAMVEHIDGFHLKQQRVEGRGFQHEANPQRHLDISGISLDKLHQRELWDDTRLHLFPKRCGRANHHLVHDKPVEGAERKRKRPFHHAVSDGPGQIDRFGSRFSYKGRSVREPGRLGPRRNDRARMKISSVSSFSSEHGSLKVPAETQNPEERRRVSDFAGPKSLAELKAEKWTGKSCGGDMTTMGKNKNAEKFESGGSFSSAISKSDAQASSAYLSEPKGMKLEKKLILGKLVSESKTVTSFEGPKPLSALLEAKKEAEKENKAQQDSFRKTGIKSVVVNKAFQDNAVTLSAATADGSKDLAKKDERSRIEMKGIEVNKCNVYDLHLHPVYGEKKRVTCSFEGENWQNSKKHLDLHSCGNCNEMVATARSESNEGLGNEEEDVAAEYDEDDEFAKTLGGLFS